MRLKQYLATAVCLAALHGRAALADEATPATPAAAPETVDPMSKVLPEVNLNSMRLDDSLQFLQDIAPDFKTVVVREKGVPDDYPIVNIRLKKVTLGQVWEVLQASVPELEVQPVAGNEGATPIYLVRIKAPSGDAPPAEPPALRVYPLGPLVDALSAKTAKEPGHTDRTPEQRPLDHILSLIKATLALTPGHVEPVLQVHEETRTLIFKGTAEQKAALEEALAAVDPGSSQEGSKLAEYQKNYAELRLQKEGDQKLATMQIEKLETELTELRARLNDEQKKSLDRTAEAEKLKLRLEDELDRMAQLKMRSTDRLDEPGKSNEPPRVGNEAHLPDGISKLTAAMAAGDEVAVGLFYRRYFDWLYDQARRATRRDEAFCLDVVQDAVLRIIRTIKAVETEPALRSWLKLVVRAAAFDLLRHESRRRRREQVGIATRGESVAGDECEGPDEEQIAWLRREIAMLDPKLVHMIELRFEKGWTLQRIGSALGMSAGTIDGRLRRALRQLRQRADPDDAADV